jgi:hypothetical protein
MRQELLRAEDAWQMGQYERAESILKVLASIAYAEANERSEHGPVPELIG